VHPLRAVLDARVRELQRQLHLWGGSKKRMPNIKEVRGRPGVDSARTVLSLSERSCRRSILTSEVCPSGVEPTMSQISRFFDQSAPMSNGSVARATASAMALPSEPISVPPMRFVNPSANMFCFFKWFSKVYYSGRCCCHSMPCNSAPTRGDILD
jgi:hypothetical protein